MRWARCLGAGVNTGEDRDGGLQVALHPVPDPPAHHFDGAHDQAERGAQFVAYRGEEAALEAAGVLGFLPGAADLLAQEQAGQRRADLLAQDFAEASPTASTASSRKPSWRF